MTAVVTVSATRIIVGGVDHLRREDLYQNAPEPPPSPEFGGLRSVAANLLYLQEELPDAAWHDPLNKALEARAFRYLQQMRASVVPGDYEAAFPFKARPDPHQLTLFAQARLMVNIAMAPVALGVGKTKMTLDIAADKFLRDEIDVLIVVAPNGVHRQWINQAVPEHLSDAVPRQAAVWKSSRKTPAEILAPRRGRRYLRILSFNVESLSGSTAPGVIRAMLQSGRAMLVVDESTRIKSGRAARTKAILRLRHLAACRVILTGMPVTKGLEDFHSQYGFLDPAIIGLSSFLAFRARYCVTAPAFRGAALGAVKIVGYKNQEELIRKIAPVTFMIGPEVLGLPPQRRERIEVEMTPEQRTLYDALAKELVDDLRARRIKTPANAVVRVLRMQQVLCGRYYESVIDEHDFETQVPRRIASNRIEALVTALEMHAGQAVIWARYHEDIDDIVEALAGIGRVCVYDGRIPPAERDAAVERFKRGEIDYFIANPAAGSTGLDGLQVCSAAFYYSNSYNFEHRFQSEGRIYRRGQTSSTLYTDLVVPNSVDTIILKNLEAKENLGRLIMDHPEMIATGGRNE
jgi:hypothetical protein